MSRLVKDYVGLNSFKDRHGKMRHYYRAPGQKAIAVHGEFGSHEFDENYEIAKAAAVGVILPGHGRIVKGSVNDLCARYYQTYEFNDKKPYTQKRYRREIEFFREKVGRVMVRAITAQHINQIKASFVGRPGAARTFLKRLNMLFNFAVDSEGMIARNPMASVKLPKEGDGFKPWSDEDITMYEERWGAGTPERLAMYLCLYTAQRRSDIVKMGRQHIKNNEISVVQQKTNARVWIPIHYKLKEELDKLPKDQMMLMVNPRSDVGKARSSEGFGNWVRQCAKDAGIEGTRGPHGLRKAACRTLIELGCSPDMAISISGHSSAKELEPYIRDVNQKKMARGAMKTWEASSHTADAEQMSEAE